jgi:penicillin-binding protein 1C
MRKRALKLGAGAAILLVLGVLTIAASRSGLESPGASHLLLDRAGRFLGEVPAPDAEDFGYWPLEDLPPRVVAATLALEDRRFWSHPGVDPIALGRALWQNVGNGRRISGASTIAMQLARLQNPGPRTYGRKLVEGVTAIALTLRHGREGVLSHYLRIVPYGNRIHGIAYAARCYLGKPVDDLSWAEIALLTSIPQSPARMNPFTPDGRRAARARGERILDALFEEGILEENEHELARRQLARLSFPERGRRPEEAMHALLRLTERVRASGTVEIVETTLDLDLQEELTRTAWSSLLDWEKEGASNAALIVVDVKTSEVLAWMGSTDYFDEAQSGAIDYTAIDRSSGSTLKPFLYGLALEKGVLTPATVVDDLPRGSAAIVNADKSYLGPMLPRAALSNSRNVPAVEVLEKVGIDEAFDLFRESTLHAGRLPARHYGLGLAIGALPVSLEHLVSAYTVLANDGRYRELVWYRGQTTAPPRQVLTEDAARQVTLFLSDPMARLPTFPRMGFNEYPFPVAVKTGTSSNYRDAWTVAYSAKYLVGVWVGRADYRPMSRMTGYGAASQLAQKVMLALHRGDDGLSNVPFPPPRGTRPVRLCALTGKRATDACDRVSSEWMPPGQEPVDFCSAHVKVAIDIRDGSVASASTPRELIETRTFVDLPPSYADWVVKTGLPRRPHSGPATPGLSREPRLSIAAPEDGLRLVTDPETPGAMATLALRAIVDPISNGPNGPQQVVWYVDGKPFQVADYPFTARWPLTPGEHRFQLRLPGTEVASNVVRVWVQ